MLVLSLVGVLLGPATQDTARRRTELPLQATVRSFRLETSRDLEVPRPEGYGPDNQGQSPGRQG